MGFRSRIGTITCIAATSLILFLSPCPAQEQTRPDTVETRDGWFCVNGEKFFVKGVCFFENHDVEGSFTRSRLEILDHEFRKIKEAGFNTIRSQLRPEELELAKKHGLMVMQGANHLFFSREYIDPQVTQKEKEVTRRVLEYSKGHDNILYYIIDNEPQVQEGIYRQGETALLSFHSVLIAEAKSVDPKAIVSMASYPPAAFLDYSIYDCVSLNLYPFCPACNSIGYEKYARWFKSRHASGKPFIISEYGWQVSRGEEEFSKTMMGLLDDQIEAGAAGSFFYTWRAFGREGSGDNLWYGIIPNGGREYDYRNEPRQIYRDFRQYFEAVIIEPSSSGSYSLELPVKVYGTDRTASVDALMGGRTFSLGRSGKYWWEAAIPLDPAGRGEKTITIIAKDADGKELVKKEKKIKTGARGAVVTVKITPETKGLKAGGSYKAKITVRGHDESPVPNQPLVLGVNETGENLWMSDVMNVRTGADGEYSFTWNNLLPGYLTVMAGVDATSADSALPDIDIARIDR